ncbi:MAG: DUF1553 domain-containing protein [Acidobacteria bacterium]|nr:DUF1553 domain-containing protein [Acidobacteriota bacterium]
MIRRLPLFVAAAAGLGAQNADVAFFETSVRPVLRTQCQACHSERNKASGLSVETREGLLAGGNRGVAAIKPGDPAGSLLIEAVEHAGTLKMPPTGKLKPEQIEVLRKWVAAGAPWPAGEVSRKRAGGDHWAFQAVKRVSPPAPSVAAWAKNAVDHFILARLDQEGLKPSPEADRVTLIRRVSLDLTGLPPTLDEVRQFVEDRSPEAYDKVVTRLLASRHYGERWGRHWLDIARYADSDGYTIDAPRTMWRYRDWVINALNLDMPFDRFVIEQYAGDQLPGASTDQLVATGFHRNTPTNFEGGIDFEQYRVEAVADRVATTGAAFLGLTLGCARCHDHKYDPVSQREYYQIFAYLNQTDEISTEDERYDYLRPTLEVPTTEETARSTAWHAQFQALSGELVRYVRQLKSQGVDAKQDLGLRERMKNLREMRRQQPRITTTLVMRDRSEPRENYIHLGGEFTRKGAAVQPGTLSILASVKPAGATRLDLARWIVDPGNPLTPRVTVNRFWQHYFGKGIVETESDFGAQGSKPTHPELLDYLASEFVRSGWSQKHIHRLIVLSATYRQSSRNREDVEEKDPYNKLLARQSRLRLDAEILRDSALRVAGLLTPTVGGPSVYPPIPEGAMAVTQVKRPWPVANGPDRYRRGLYTFFYRSAAFPSLLVFDAPDATSTCTRRVRSNTPLQALTLLNDQAFVEFAQAMALRLIDEVKTGDGERLDRAFLLALGREPRAAERDRISRFLNTQRDEFKTHPDEAKKLAAQPVAPNGDPATMVVVTAAVPEGRDPVELATWTSVARVIFNLDDFLTRE